MTTRYIAKTNSTRYLWGRSTWLKGRLRRRIRHSEIIEWRKTLETVKENGLPPAVLLSFFGRLAYRTHYVRYYHSVKRNGQNANIASHQEA